MKIWNTIISKFLSKKFLLSFLLVMLVVCGVIISISFIEELSRSDEMGNAFLNSVSKLLEWMPLFLPLAVFMSVLLMTYQLIRSSEMVILQSVGLSPIRILRPVAITAAALGVIASLVINPLAIRLDKHLSGENTSHMNMIDGKIWLTEKRNDIDTTIMAKELVIKDNKANFNGATVWIKDIATNDVERIEAASMTLIDNEFKITKPAKIYGMDGKTKSVSEWSEKSEITVQNLRERYLKPTEISFWKLPSFIQSLNKMGMNSKPHTVQFWNLLFMPLILAAMVVLGMAFSQTKSRRFHSFGLKISLGALTSFILYFTVNLFSNLGAAGILPSFIAVAIPPIVIGLFSLYFILSFNKN